MEPLGGENTSAAHLQISMLIATLTSHYAPHRFAVRDPAAVRYIDSYKL